jgi:integrase
MARHLIGGDATIKAAIARGDARLLDGDGLHLRIVVKGQVAPAWRFDYSLGTRKTLSLGRYPDVGLAHARKVADQYRRIVAEGRDPSDARKAAKDGRKQAKEATTRAGDGLAPVDSFEAVAREFHAARSKGWSPLYGARWLERMERDLFPKIGGLQLPAITPPVLLKVLRGIEARGARETAHTLRQTSGQVFRYGIATGRCERNPCPDLHGALEPIVVKHAAAILDPEKLGELMRAVADYAGQPTTKAALLLSALTFQRPGNVRAAQWDDVDLDAGTWTIPAVAMKRRLSGKLNGRPHVVPLATQTVAALRELEPLTGHGRLLFPGLVNHDRPLSENTVNLALRRMGFDGKQMVAHGFRATARTMLVERLGVDPEVVEAQLAHGKSGPLGAAYDRAEFMEQRREAMQKWANYLDRLRKGGKVMPIRAA